MGPNSTTQAWMVFDLDQAPDDEVCISKNCSEGRCNCKRAINVHVVMMLVIKVNTRVAERKGRML
jgi:hypothetical protein